MPDRRAHARIQTALTDAMRASTPAPYAREQFEPRFRAYTNRISRARKPQGCSDNQTTCSLLGHQPCCPFGQDTDCSPFSSLGFRSELPDEIRYSSATVRAPGFAKRNACGMAGRRTADSFSRLYIRTRWNLYFHEESPRGWRNLAFSFRRSVRRSSCARRCAGFAGGPRHGSGVHGDVPRWAGAARPAVKATAQVDFRKRMARFKKSDSSSSHREVTINRIVKSAPWQLKWACAE